MTENVPVPDVDAYVGSIGFLPNSYHRAMQECVEEMARRVTKLEERLAPTEELVARDAAGCTKECLDARQDEQPFNCLDDCATQRHKWDTMRRQMKQSCEENNKLIDALLLASTRADEAEEKLAVVEDLLRNVERDKAELLKDDDQLTGTLASMISRIGEAEKEVTFLIEANARFRKNCDNMREAQSQALTRAKNAEAGLCSFNAKNVALNEENERLRRDYTKLYKIVLKFKETCGMEHSDLGSGTLRCAASILTVHQCPILASDLRAMADAMEAALEATEEAGL